MSLRSCLLVITSLLVSSTAVAQELPELSPRAAGHRVWLSTDVWPAKDFVMATMALDAQIAVHKAVAIDVELPWVIDGEKFGGDFGPNGKHAGLGNITVGAHGVLMPAPTVGISLGASVSIPMRFHYDGGFSSQLQFMSVAATSRGYLDAHRFGPELVFIRVPVGIEWRINDVLYYRGELTPQIWGPIGDDVNTKSLQMRLEHADELEARAHVGFGGGVRVQAVFACTSSSAFDSGDRVQTALEPFLGYEPAGTGVWGRFGLLFALDTPLGFGFKTDRLAVLRAQVGGKF